MGDSATPAPDAPAPHPETLSAAPPASAAPIIYQGPVSLWMGFKTFLFGGLMEIAGLGALIYGSLNSGAAWATALLIVGAALLMSSTVMLAYTILNIKHHRYTITKRLIENERGLFFKKIDALDLGRVSDVELSQGLIDRMLNIGTIIVLSSDRTDPVMRIEALPNPRPTYEQLRDAVIEIGRRRGVVQMNQ